MVRPEALADVRHFKPGVDQDALFVAGDDQIAQVFVALGVGLPVMPRRDLESGDARLAPAGGEIIEIDPDAVGGIEERPDAGGAHGRMEAEIVERLEQIGEPLIALFAGRRGDPQDGAGAARDGGHQRRARPTLAGEDAGVGGQGELGQIERVLPNDLQLRRMDIHQTAHRDAILRGFEAERFGDLGFAFENEKRPLVHLGQKFGGRSGRAAAHDEDVGRKPGARGETDASENLWPRAGIVTGDGIGDGGSAKRRRSGGESEDEGESDSAANE